MADKILRQENDQFVHTDLVAFTENVGVGYNISSITDQIPSGSVPFTLTIGGSDGISIPMGTEAERPTSASALSLPILRYNTDSSEFESFNPNLDLWIAITSDSDLASLSAQVQQNTSNISQNASDIVTLSGDVDQNVARLDALEYVDIDVTALTVTEGTVFEFDIPATPYTLTFNWVINKTPTSNELQSQSYGTTLLSNTATGSNSDDYSITNTTGAEVSKWWRCSAESVDGLNSSSDTYTRNVYWVYPFYWGTSVNDYSTGGVEALTKDTSRKGTKVVGMDATDEYLYFAYPASYGDLTLIKDGNNLDNTDNFDVYTYSITGTSNVAIPYKIYRTNSVTTINQNFTFIY